MSIERLQQYYGFTRMPFGRGLAPGMLHRHPGHSEAVAKFGKDPRTFSISTKEFLGNERGELTGLITIDVAWTKD